MSAVQVGLAVSVFLACLVEAVEALTIVLAVGATRSWRSALWGVATATLALAIVVAALGPALTAIPLNVLRAVVGALLLIFGIGWLVKAILRASGHKALHDEATAFARETEQAAGAGLLVRTRLDHYSFVIAFKGCFLEGIEVVFIVLTFGTNEHDVPLAVAVAALAVVAVVLGGIALRAPLARVPENAMKFVVGVMLTSFGCFWSAEGVGAHWPGAEVALLGVITSVAVFSLALVLILRGGRPGFAT